MVSSRYIETKSFKKAWLGIWGVPKLVEMVNPKSLIIVTPKKKKVGWHCCMDLKALYFSHMVVHLLPQQLNNKCQSNHFHHVNRWFERISQNTLYLLKLPQYQLLCIEPGNLIKILEILRYSSDTVMNESHPFILSESLFFHYLSPFCQTSRDKP